MLCTVTPSSPIQTPPLKKKVQTTSSLASWSSNALVPSIDSSKTTPPPSEYISSQAMINVHSRGIPDGLPGPLPPRPLTLGSQSQKSSSLQGNTNSPAHTVRPPWLPSCVRISSLSESHTCHPFGTVWQPNTSIPTRRYDTSIEPPRTLHTCWIRWTPASAQPFHPIAPWILWIPATNKLPHCNHNYCLRMPSYEHICIRLLAYVCWDVIELTQMALSLHNNLIRSSNQVPKVTIHNGNREFYLLATWEYWGIFRLSIQSWGTICDHCSTNFYSAHR